ncbi:MAG: SDR family oxidoreductase, partial [SAR202 cluster bacterium]|nr:SDR family oxidoreductase [SAR202 cluster bacterium]
LIASAKSGLEGLIRSCSATYGHKGYRFNCIAPALIETKLSSKFVSNDKAKEMVSNMNVLNKIGQPNDITKCLSWLLSDESDFVTGQTINIDGGMNNINTRIVR